MADDNVLIDGVPLPDSRLTFWARSKRTEYVRGSYTWEKISCVNCGDPMGAVTKGTPVFGLCDDCVGKWGPPPGAIEIPESWCR